MKKLYLIVLSILCVFTLGCRKKGTPEPAGNLKLYLTEISFIDYLVTGLITGNVHVTIYSAVDTSSSLIITEHDSKFTITSPHKFSQIVGYNLGDNVKKVEFSIYFDMGDYAAKAVEVKNISVSYKGETKYSQSNVYVNSTTGGYTSTFILDPITVEF